MEKMHASKEQVKTAWNGPYVKRIINVGFYVYFLVFISRKDQKERKKHTYLVRLEKTRFHN